MTGNDQSPMSEGTYASAAMPPQVEDRLRLRAFRLPYDKLLDEGRFGKGEGVTWQMVT